MKKTINLNDFSDYKNFSFAQSFIDIINTKAEDYDTKANIKENLKGFFEDLQKGGCVSGMIAEFIYHSDCKEFYISHIEELEEFKQEFEEQIGTHIENRQKLPHYTFICWLAFEEFCYNIYTNMFEN
jgi:hypothetical protein